MLTVFFETFGCQMNVADSDLLADLLAQQGYAATDSASSADLIVVNTCSVRDHAEQRARARLSELARAKRKSGRDQALWVVGCMAQRLGQALAEEIPGVDRVIGAVEIEDLHRHISQYLEKKASTLDHRATPAGVSAFVPVMRGCNNYCSYCVVPYVRGSEHSVPASEVEATVRSLVGRGVREVTLLGQNVNSYADPCDGPNFTGLIRRLHEVEGLLRIRFTTSHPKDCSEDLLTAVAELPKVCKHLHLPVQSGSTRILRAMNRGYTREDYLRLTDKIRQRIPAADITTDVMVGFPGETEQDFRDTIALFETVRFTAAFMFAYSPRPGTKAADMTDTVPPATSKARLTQLIRLQTDITKQYYQTAVGGVVQMLVTERQARPGGMWMGQDNGAKRALLADPSDLTGRLVSVRVRQTTGMTLVCERT